MVYITEVEDAIGFVEHNISVCQSVGDYDDTIKCLKNTLRCLQALHKILEDMGQ